MTSQHHQVKAMTQIIVVAWSILILLHGVQDIYVRATHINSFAGPFIVVIEKIANCQKEQSGLNLLQTDGIITHNQRNASQNKVFNGIFYVLFPIDDYLTAQVSLAGWNSVSGWVPNAFHFTFKRFCSSLFVFGKEIIGGLLRYCKERPPLRCPLEKKNYTVENLPTAFRLKHIPSFHYGKYKSVVQMYRKEKASEKEVLSACVLVEMRVVAREYVQQTILDL